MGKALLPDEMPPREVLSGKFRFRTPLRCEGIGKLDCVADLHTGQRKVVRWLPLETNRHGGQNIVHFCANLPLHSSLPEVCEIGEMESWAYMVLDFPEGDLLAARKALLKPGAWREMAFQLAGALGALHAEQVFHGEFCMPSVMLLEAEQPLLWDMQLVLCSRMADRREEERVLKQLSRTASTMAPERARGGPLTSEGDVYSLGAVLAYAGGGQPAGSSTLALLHAVATGNFKPHIPSGLPPTYQDMLARMLSPNASARPGMREVEAFFAEPPRALFSNALLSNIPSPGIPSSKTPPLFPLPKLSATKLSATKLPAQGPVRVAARSKPSPSAPLVSGVDWIHMLSPEKEEKSEP